MEPWQLATLIHVQLGELSAAEQLLTHALTALPQDASLYNSLGNVLSRAQRWPEAIEAYQQAISLQPVYPGALTNLGNAYVQQQATEQAKNCYLRALTADEDYPDAHFNYARLLLSLQQTQEAEQHLRRTLAIIPQHAAALGQLAELCLQRADYAQAIELLTQRVTLQPQHAAGWQSLGNAKAKLSQFAAAIDCYSQALSLDPALEEIEYQLATAYLAQGDRDSALQHYLRQLAHAPHLESLYNIGVLLSDKQRDDDAIRYFQQALSLDPTYQPAQLNLAAIYLKKNSLTEAIHHYTQALMLDPDNVEIQHILQALTATDTPTAAPLSYAEHLFDHYATVYDQHLTQQLKYQAPHALFDRVASALYPEPNSLVILDLGCGTGLAGALFAPYAKRLIGVDISSNMIELARTKHLYHELITADLETALAQQQAIDLIIAADVFPYLGDLHSVFSLAYQALKPGGMLAFTTEQAAGTGYVLQKSIRYAHSAHYLTELTLKTGFTLYDQAAIVLRQQYQQPVDGWLFLVRKPQG